jgi:hypothetical protein
MAYMTLGKQAVGFKIAVIVLVTDTFSSVNVMGSTMRANCNFIESKPSRTLSTKTIVGPLSEPYSLLSTQHITHAFKLKY